MVAQLNQMAEASYARGMRAYHEHDAPNLLREIGYLRAFVDVAWSPEAGDLREIALSAKRSLERAAVDLGVS